jgi:uncharacterized protein YqgC (DUF456 family)
MRASVLSILAALGLAMVSLLFLRNAPRLTAVFLVYAVLWAWSGVVYHRGSRFGYYAVAVFTVPWILILGAQFCRRIFYLIAYGGDAPDEMGSPLAFLIGWIFETPPTLVILILGLLLLREWRHVRPWNTEPGDAPSDGPRDAS